MNRCGLSWCKAEVIAHDLPLCYGHWHAVPQERRHDYCRELSVPVAEAKKAQDYRDREFMAWCEINLKSC